MAEANNSLRTEVEKLLRSVVQSEKDGIPLHRLSKEYSILEGQQIPFRQLGFNSITEMLNNMPNVVRLKKNSSNETIVHAVSDECTAHIASLVSRQKSNKPRGNSRRRPAQVSRSRARYFPQNTTPRPRSTHPAHISNKQLVRPKSISPQPPLYPVVPVVTMAPLSPHSNIQTKIKSPLNPANAHQRPILSAPPVDPYMPPADVYIPPKNRYGYETPPRLKKLQEMKKAGEKPKPPAQQENKKPLDPAEKNKQLLENYCEKNGWKPPEYKAVTFNKKDGVYYCTVKIGSKTYRSYPDNGEKTASAATATVAKIAVEELKLNQGSSTSDGNLLTTPAVTSAEISCLVSRIGELLADKRAGLFYDHLCSEYEQKYHEQLPSDWLSLVKNNSDIQVSPSVDGRDILYPSRVSGESTPKETSRRQSIVSDNSDNQEYNASIPPLQLPEGVYWDVHIAYVKSPSMFAVRLVDYNDEYGDLLDRLEEYYKNNLYPVTEFVESKLYAVNIENNWHRGEAYGISKTQVQCYFIDHGDLVWIDKSNIQELHASFYQLPAQAILCELYEYSYDKECRTNEELMKCIFNNTYVAEVVNRDEDFPVQVILYDTSTEEDININQMFLDKLIIELTTPVLPAFGKFKEVFISFVTPKEDIYVVCNGVNVELLKAIVDEAATSCEERAGTLKNAIVGKLYLAKYEDGFWYRAIVQKVFNNKSKQVELFYVDYGNTEILNVSAICELDLSSLITKIPYQAIKCRLSGIPRKGLKWTSAVTERLQTLAPEEQILEMTIISEAQSGMPMQVVFCKRLPSTNEAVSVNHTLTLEEDLFEKDEDEINNITVQSSQVSLLRTPNNETYSELQATNNIHKCLLSKEFTE